MHSLHPELFWDVKWRKKSPIKKFRLIVFLRLLEKEEKSRTKGRQQKITEFPKEDCKTVFPYKTSSNTFTFGSLKCHSSSISNTAWGKQNNKTVFYGKLVLTAGSIGHWKGSIVESKYLVLWGSNCSRLDHCYSCTTFRKKLVRKSPFIMRFMTHTIA